MALPAALVIGDAAVLAAPDSSPQSIAADPAVGGPTTTVRLHYVAEGVHNVYGPNELEVDGPAGTPCAGVVAGGRVVGPRADESGPATLYIGPDAAREYPMASNIYDLTGEVSGGPLKRWCPGAYTGNVGYLGPGGVDDTFQFRIVAAVTPQAPSPADVARHLRPVNVSPQVGHSKTIFAVQYRADPWPYDRGDVTEVDGPKRSACRGSVVRAGTLRRDGQSGPVTLHVGPDANRNSWWKAQSTALVPFSGDGNGAPLRCWCLGTYNGTIFYEHGPKFTVVARFKLRVGA